MNGEGDRVSVDTSMRHSLGSETKKRWPIVGPSTGGTPALMVFALAFVILASTTLASIDGSFGTDTGHAAKEGAHAAAIDPSSVTLVASPSAVLVNDSITFFANASSDDSGAILRFTTYYDCLDQAPTINPEGPVTVDNSGAPWTVVRTFAYNHPGNLTQGGLHYFWVFVFVSDGTDNYSAGIQVYVNSPPPPPVNTPPFFEAPPDTFSASAGTVQQVLIKIADNDSDTVTVFWDFGDGTNATNVTVAPPTGIVLSQTHSWNPRIPGKGDYIQNYTLSASLSDGHHPPVNASAIISIQVPTNGPPNIRDPGIRASKATAGPLERVNFSVGASDPEGDPLTWTFNYSDGSLEVYHTGFTAPGLLLWRNTTHAFASAGNYTVRASVSDALIGFQNGTHNLTVSTIVDIILNSAPFISAAIRVDPNAPVVNATTGFVNVTLSVEAYDPDGDMFNLTWDLGVFGNRTNGSFGDAAQRMDPHKFSQVITFNEAGSLTFAVTVTDGRPDHEVTRGGIVNVSSNNRPPIVREFYQSYVKGDSALVNQTVNFTLVMTDPEHDAIELIWNFGDGSPRLFMNVSDYDSQGNITVLVNHSYARLGNYNVTIILTDNKVGGFNHTLNYTVHIRVSAIPPVKIVRWTWWDYVSLSLFASIPVLFVLWGLAGVRRRREEEMSPSFVEGESGPSTEDSLGHLTKKGDEGGG